MFDAAKGAYERVWTTVEDDSPQTLVSLMLTWAVSRKKVPNVLSRCHTKRTIGACGRAHPSFGMTPTFQKKK